MRGLSGFGRGVACVASRPFTWRVGWFRRCGDDHQLRALHARGLHDAEIGELLGFSRVTILVHRRRLGLESNGSHDERTNRKRAASIGKALRAQGLEFGEATRVAYAIRALRLGWAGRPLREALILHVLEDADERASTSLILELAGDLRQRLRLRRALGLSGLLTGLVGLRAAGLVESTRPTRGKPATHWLSTRARRLVASRKRAHHRGRPPGGVAGPFPLGVLTG